jgi:hypothetical protein
MNPNKLWAAVTLAALVILSFVYLHGHPELLHLSARHR